MFTDAQVNMLVKLGDENENTVYRNKVKEVWKKLYSSGYTVQQIASIWGASTYTVKYEVDESFREKERKSRVERNRRYRETHTAHPWYSSRAYKQDLINRKREILGV